MKKVQIYTDGSSRGNPGPGGFGTILRYGKHSKELSQGFVKTTNNRMELLAALVGLESLTTKCSVTVYSDSKYLINAMTQGWIEGWRAKNWSRGKGKPLKNVDLWKRIFQVAQAHEIDWQWVKGHAGHLENERCDELATTAADSDDLIPDTGFIEEPEEENLL